MYVCTWKITYGQPECFCNLVATVCSRCSSQKPQDGKVQLFCGLLSFLIRLAFIMLMICARVQRLFIKRWSMHLHTHTQAYVASSSFFAYLLFFVSPLNFADSQLLHTFLCLCVLICVCVCVLTKFPTQHVYLRIGFFVAIVKSVVAYIVYFCYSFFWRLKASADLPYDQQLSSSSLSTKATILDNEDHIIIIMVLLLLAFFLTLSIRN